MKALLSKEMENDLQRQKDVIRLKRYKEQDGRCELTVKIVDE